MTLWHGYVSQYAHLHMSLTFYNFPLSSAEGVDSSTVGVTHEVNNTDPFCPFPEPFLMNTNTSDAALMSDDFNGTQPEHAGVYTCYSNGLPRATVEIIVLGNKLDPFRYSCSDRRLTNVLTPLQFLWRHHLCLRLSFGFLFYH